MTRAGLVVGDPAGVATADAGLYGDLLLPKRGALQVPQAPGLGADPDAEVMRRYRADRTAGSSLRTASSAADGSSRVR